MFSKQVLFRCFALELCAGTLQQYCDRTYFGPMPGQLEAMIQMSSGLCHIHTKHLVHGDIKPENILLSFPDSSSKVVLKISEFGLCKIAPKLHYIAPELQDCSSTEKDFHKISTSSSDTYALGYTFVHFLNRSCSENGYWIDGIRYY
jgi:serine/threonine protein kinase